MKKLLALNAIVILVAGAILFVDRAQSQAEVQATQWEYKCIEAAIGPGPKNKAVDTTQKINALAVKGWRLTHSAEHVWCMERRIFVK